MGANHLVIDGLESPALLSAVSAGRQQNSRPPWNGGARLRDCADMDGWHTARLLLVLHGLRQSAKQEGRN
jgi:hypothetical protein